MSLAENRAITFPYYFKRVDTFYDVVLKGTHHNNIVDIFCLDSTELHKAQQKLSATNNKLAMALDVANIVPWKWDLRSKTILCDINRPIELSTNDKDVNEEQLAVPDSQYFSKIFKEDRKRVEKAYDDLIEGRSDKVKEEYRVINVQNNIHRIEWVEAQAAVETRDENGKPLTLVGSSLVITTRKKMEMELTTARDRAEESNRLKSAFLANMSHEIRTPLNAIVGFSHLMTIADNAEDEKLYSDIINQNSEILLQLINDILDLAKIEAGTLEYIRYPMDLGELCRNVYEMHKDRVQTGVVLILDNKDTSLIINEDQNRIMQVVTNLITNAIKFTFKGEIRFGFEVREEYIDFYVKDTGMGISEEKIKMIFERFVKLNTFVQGTGLGLAICRVIVEKLGGEITAESKLNEGSTFRFTIPYKAGKKIPESGKVTKCPESGSTGPRKVLQRRTVLVAEDVDSNFLLLKTLLGKRCNLLWAKNGEDAVNQFKEHQPDLILMDIKMPHMDGLEATRLIRSYSKEVPIVALTAFAFESDKDRAIEAGCDDFLTKPVSQNALEKVLDKYVK